MRVEINMVDGCDFPRLCPCCLGSANQLETIKGARPAGVYDVTALLEVPVCGACLAHRRAGLRAALTIVGIGLALLLVSLLLRELANVRQGSIGYVVAEVLAMLFLLSLVMAAVAFFWIRWRWPRSHSPHVRAGKAVKVAPVMNLEKGVLLDFANEEYGRLFRQMNSSRLTAFEAARNSGR